jgi:hypothetical protein
MQAATPKGSPLNARPPAYYTNGFDG